jgi:hypothetical protein
MISHTMNPTGQANGGTDIGLPKGGTGVAAVTVHFKNPGLMLLRSIGVRSTAGRRMENRREKRMMDLFCQGRTGLRAKTGDACKPAHPYRPSARSALFASLNTSADFNQPAAPPDKD